MTIHNLADQAKERLVQAIAGYMIQCNVERANALAAARQRYEQLSGIDLGPGAPLWRELIADATERFGVDQRQAG